MTESRQSRKRARLFLTLTPEQEEVLNDYLARSTCLWNFLLHHAKTEIEEYIQSEGSLESYQALTSRVKSYTDYLISYSTHLPENINISPGVDPQWVKYISYIQVLNSSTIQMRAENLLEAFASYVASSSQSKTIKRPRAKTERSAQAVHFSDTAIKVSDALLTLEGFRSFGVTIPELKNLDFKVRELVIGRRALPEATSEERYGPQQDKFFVILAE